MLAMRLWGDILNIHLEWRPEHYISVGFDFSYWRDIPSTNGTLQLFPGELKEACRIIPDDLASFIERYSIWYPESAVEGTVGARKPSSSNGHLASFHPGNAWISYFTRDLHWEKLELALRDSGSVILDSSHPHPSHRIQSNLDMVQDRPEGLSMFDWCA